MEYYGIKVGGVEVTSDNYSNIRGRYIKGMVSYIQKINTLILNNATIRGGIDFGDPPRVGDITITLVGENLIDTIGSTYTMKTINGCGTLVVTSFIYCLSEKNTIIEDCTIISDKYDSAIYKGNTLVIKNANISMKDMTGVITDFKNIKLIGCKIVEPIGVQIIDNECNEKYICDADGNVAERVVIQRI